MRATKERHFTQWHETGLFCDAIDYATAASPAKDHCIGSLKGLDTLNVVEITVVLDVISHAINKKISKRGIAADDDLISVVFSLMGGDAGNVPYNIADTKHQLITHLLLGHKRYRLRNITHGRKRLSRCTDCWNLIALALSDAHRFPHHRQLQEELMRLRPKGLGTVERLGQFGK